MLADSIAVNLSCWTRAFPSTFSITLQTETELG